MAVEVRRTEELSNAELDELRALFDAVWPDPNDRFTDEDWDHTVGGVHFLIREAGEIVSHASVVERELHTGGHRLRTGYVEAVATREPDRRRGLGSSVMREAGRHIDEGYELGALGADLFGFYGRLGWVPWRGPTSVRTADGQVRTPDEDGYVLVRITPSTPRLDLDAPLSCDWRPGDAW